MKKLIALAMASVVALSLFGCGKEKDDPSPTPTVPDNKVSVWLPISRTEYNADGSNGSRQTTYTYTDTGLPLSEISDQGLIETHFDDELGIYEYIYHGFDGTPNTEYHYDYNDRGDYLSYSQTINNYDSNGQLENSQHKDFSKDLCKYNYRSDGKIDSVEWYSQNADGTVNEQISAIYHHCYDDRGNLVEIYKENLLSAQSYWHYDFRYDAENRLIAAVFRAREFSRLYQYEYDNQGRLADVKFLHGAFQTPLDNQHVSQSTAPHNYRSFDLMGGARFTYDSNGNLITRECYASNNQPSTITRCTYDAYGKLSTVTSGDTKYVFVDDEKDANSSATTLVRDENGNIVKVIDSDGDYVEYQYQEFRLTPEEAAKCKNILLAKDNIDPLGDQANAYGSYFRFIEGNGFIGYLPMVQTVLQPLDVLMSEN